MRRQRPFDPFERGGPFGGAAPVRIPRPPRRFWVGAVLIGLAVLIFLFASPIVWFITEKQWYTALGLADVFTTRLQLQAALFVGSFTVALAYLGANVLVALRVKSDSGLRKVGIRRSALRTATGAVGLGAAGLVALILSGGAGTQWQALILFQHSTPTGTTDPVLGQDLSFYLLTLPFLHSVVSWAMGLGFMGVLLIAALYAWRGDTFDLRLGADAIAHLSVMLGLFALVLAVWTWFGRYDLLYAHNSSIVWGAAYTDVNARLPLLTFEAGAAVVGAGALLLNTWLRRGWLPGATIAVWIGLLIVAQAYPSVVQYVSVTPNAQSFELPYIDREIAGTRAAYGLTNVTTKPYTGDKPVTLEEVQGDRATIDNLRLWDFPQPLLDNYEQLQTIRTYYHFARIGIDRYTVGGTYTSLEIGAREMDVTQLPTAARNWVNEHLQYTHGYGVAANAVNAVEGEGLPSFVAKNLPPEGSLPVTKPAIYFGLVTSEYALAPSGVKEFDYPGTPDVYTNYTGSHGVHLDSVNRALWAMKLSDFNLLVSTQITDSSEILYRRQIMDRVTEIAPFLTFDSDPYPVVVDGRVYWIVDAYTTASTYPYSQAQDDGSFNYIRNSVKVVVDAYEGTTDFYVNEPKDPIINAYRGAFPTMFKPLEAMPTALRAHLRVPQDLFKYQVNIYKTYHITDAKVFFAREDVWDLPTGQSGPSSLAQDLTPYYVLFRLPGEQNPEYLLIMPFTPKGKPFLVSWLAVRSDGDHYGEMVSFVLPKDKVIFGPQQVANRINENPAISRDFSLFHQAGSTVLQGNLLVVPVGDSFLYFEPIYLRANQAQSLPELKKVILADQSQVVYSDSLSQAIDQLVGGSAGITTPTGTPPTGTPSTRAAQISDLVDQANTHYAAGYAALKKGDFATFANEMALVGKLLQQLQALTGSTPASPAPTP